MECAEDDFSTMRMSSIMQYFSPLLAEWAVANRRMKTLVVAQKNIFLENDWFIAEKKDKMKGTTIR